MQTDQPGISEYYRQFSEIVAALQPGFIYLRPTSARENSRFVANLRGRHRADKVSSGETSTPFATRNGLQGIDGMHEFWEMYAKLCDSVFDQWKHPKKQIRFKHGNYTRHFDEAMSFVEKPYEFTNPLSEAG